MMLMILVMIMAMIVMIIRLWWWDEREKEREEEKMNDLIDRRKENKTKIKQQKQSIESLFKFFGERERKQNEW